MIREDNHGYKFAVIKNDFEEVGIDNGLLLQTNE